MTTPLPWRDEDFTKKSIEQWWGELGQMITHLDLVHALYYALMKVYTAAAGTSILALRLPSVVAVAGTAVVVYFIGRRLLGFWGGVTAGLASGMLPHLIWASTEARSYALTALLASVTVLLFLRAVERGTWRSWAAYGTALLVSILMFADTALLVPALLLHLVGVGRPLVRWLVASGVVGLLLAPFVWALAHQQGQLGWIKNVTAATLARLPRDLLHGVGEWPVYAALLAVGLVAAVVIAQQRRDWAPVLLPVLWIAVPTALLLAAGVFARLYYPRYLTFTAPAFALLLAAPVGLGRRLRWLAVPILVVLAVVGLGPWRTYHGVTAKPGTSVAAATPTSSPGSAATTAGAAGVASGSSSPR